tara:strand:- start:49 stop:738 length:690 start_codon:yes stop_codon:yes gene_type:complete
MQSPAGISFQNFGANGSRNWRIRPDDLAGWSDLDFSCAPTDGSADIPDTAADNVLSLQGDTKDVKICNGNLILSNTKGISFYNHGSGVGSNLLDDYEEGTFTPTVSFTSGGSPSYTTQQGVYTKIGDVMHAWAMVELSSVSGCTGGLRITLPVTASESTLSNQHMGTIWFIVGLNYSSYGNYGVQVGVNGTVGDIYAFTAATGSNYNHINVSNMSNNTMLKYQLTYKVA